MTELAVIVDEGQKKLADEIVSCAKELLDGKDEVVRIISPGISVCTIMNKKDAEVLVVIYSHTTKDGQTYGLIQDEWAFYDDEVVHRITTSEIEYSPESRADGRQGSYRGPHSQIASEVSPEDLSNLLKALRVSTGSRL